MYLKASAIDTIDLQLAVWAMALEGGAYQE